MHQIAEERPRLGTGGFAWTQNKLEGERIGSFCALSSLKDSVAESGKGTSEHKWLQMRKKANLSLQCQPGLQLCSQAPQAQGLQVSKVCRAFAISMPIVQPQRGLSLEMPLSTFDLPSHCVQCHGLT